MFFAHTTLSKDSYSNPQIEHNIQICRFDMHPILNTCCFDYVYDTHTMTAANNKFECSLRIQQHLIKTITKPNFIPSLKYLPNISHLQMLDCCMYILVPSATAIENHLSAIWESWTQLLQIGQCMRRLQSRDNAF